VPHVFGHFGVVAARDDEATLRAHAGGERVAVDDLAQRAYGKWDAFLALVPVEREQEGAAVDPVDELGVECCRLTRLMSARC
jgi:hypothetical protein